MQCSPYTPGPPRIEREKGHVTCSLLQGRALADPGEIRELQRTPENGGEPPFPGTRMCNVVVFHWTGPRCLEISVFSQCWVLHATGTTPTPGPSFFLSHPSPLLQVFRAPNDAPHTEDGNLILEASTCSGQGQAGLPKVR